MSGFETKGCGGVQCIVERRETEDKKKKKKKKKNKKKETFNRVN